MATRVRSYSKVNLGLRIGPVRPDGYHGLMTMYQTIDLHDVVTVEARLAAKTRLVLRSTDSRVPTDGRNTAWALLERALTAAGVAAEVEVTLEKRLPVQGGLGAGSANAAAALLGLEREMGLEPGQTGWLSGAERLRIAGEVGSDVPLFLVGGTVLGFGRGELVAPVEDVCGGEGLACVVAVPRVGVSTPMAFRRWDQGVAAQQLTDAAGHDRLSELSRTYASAFAVQRTGGIVPASSGISQQPAGPRDGAWNTSEDERVSTPAGLDQATKVLRSLVRTGIENDFEDVAFSFHPSLREIKRCLTGDVPEQGAVYAALSGSGASLFGVYATDAAAAAAQQRVQRHGNMAVRSRTIPRGEYWRSLFCKESVEEPARERVD